MLQVRNNLVKILQFSNLTSEQERNAPVCGMTLRAAGSMRFRWAESNPVRDKMFADLCSPSPEETVPEKISAKTPVPVQLDHTHIVYDVKTADDTFQKIGDGIITVNRDLVPTITVADCVPIYLYDVETGVFGIVHSGWKGTGIIADAIALACKNYNARPENFRIIIGPHIHDCCYIVDENRADFFRKNFTPDCVRPLEDGVVVDWNFGSNKNTPGNANLNVSTTHVYSAGTSPVKLYRLSLARANLAALENVGVPRCNINVYDDCTCCDSQFGSNRRETKENGRPDLFTVQAAFIRF